MKGTFPFKPESSEIMAKTSNLSCKNKTKEKKKNWRQTIKTITDEFECFDVRPRSSFYNEKQQELYCAYATNIMLKNI